MVSIDKRKVKFSRHHASPAKLVVSLFLSCLTVTAWARGEITLIQTEAVPAQPSSQVVNGATYHWGVGVNTRIRSFIFNDRTLSYNPVVPDEVNLIRVDNPQATGEPCSIYAEIAGDNYGYQPTFPGNPDECPMAAIISGDDANLGALDVFSNQGVKDYHPKNIERVDLIFRDGIVSSADDTTLAGHTVLDKTGNNPIKIAAILSLDDKGQPATYGPLVTIHANSFGDSDDIQYGLTNFSSINAFLANMSKKPNGLMFYRTKVSEPLGFAFVTLKDLGINAGQVYYGISAFGPDVDASVHTLTDPATFPKDTDADNGGDDADLHLGSGGYLQRAPVNAPPVARADTARTEVGIAVSIDALANDTDPDGDPLSMELNSDPQHGTAIIEDGKITYTPEQDYSGEDQIGYTIEDGRGGRSSAVITITIDPIEFQSAVLGDTGESRIIETGLQGHGAGGFGGMLGVLAIGGLFRCFGTKEATR